MLSEKVLQALQDQMNKERMNAQQYAALAGYLDAENWPGFSKWMLKASEDELTHFHKFESYLIDRNAAPFYTALDVPIRLDGSVPLPLFEAALKLEQENTVSILALDELADEDMDEQTDTFLIWAIDEQTKSERELVDAILELGRVDATGLLILDREYGEK